LIFLFFLDDLRALTGASMCCSIQLTITELTAQAVNWIEKRKSDLYRPVPEEGVLMVGYKLIGMGKESLFNCK